MSGLMSSRSGFPGEILDYIIDFLHWDVRSLKACALVCTAWTPSARFHLFNTITCHPDKPGRTVAQIAAWTSSEHGVQASRYITTLVVTPSGSYTSLPTVGVTEIALLMTRMPNIRRVTLDHVSIHHFDIARHTTLPGASHTRPLIQLTILRCETLGDSFHIIGHLLCLYPQIDKLDFIHTSCLWDPTLESTPWFTFLLTRLRVKELCVRSVDISTQDMGYMGLYRIFRRSNPPWPLRKLELAVPLWPQTSHLADFLESCTTSLVDLEVNVIPTGHLIVESRPETTRTSFLRLQPHGLAADV